MLLDPARTEATAAGQHGTTTTLACHIGGNGLARWSHPIATWERELSANDPALGTGSTHTINLHCIKAPARSPQSSMSPLSGKFHNALQLRAPLRVHWYTLMYDAILCQISVGNNATVGVISSSKAESVVAMMTALYFHLRYYECLDIDDSALMLGVYLNLCFHELQGIGAPMKTVASVALCFAWHAQLGS